MSEDGQAAGQPTARVFRHVAGTVEEPFVLKLLHLVRVDYG